MGTRMASHSGWKWPQKSAHHFDLLLLLIFSTRKIESKMYMWREKLHYYVYTSLYSKLSLLEVITWAQGVADHWLEDFWCTTTKIRVLERHTNIDDEPVDQHHEMKNAPNMHHIIKKVLFFLQPYLMSKLSISWLQTLSLSQKNPRDNQNFFLFFPASFYGSGYASLPFEDAQSTTDLSFRFRTSRAESLLVLVAGRTDYCLVMLQAGAVKVRYDYCLWPPLLWPTSLRSLKWKLWYCAIIILTVY